MTAPPLVQLVNIFPGAFDNFVATARTCYSSKGIVTAEQVAGAPDSTPSELETRRERKMALATSLFKAGHHTTLQHAHAQFALDRVSRHAIWSFLHAHPFYNSEQVSQRYVTVKPGTYHEPDGLGTDANRELFHRAVERQMQAYESLCAALAPVVEREYYSRFNGRYGSKRAQTDIRKKAQEIARYVLPIATFAYLYHTVSIVTLLRYWRLCTAYDVPAEQRRIAEAMVNALLAHEPEFRSILQDPMPLEETPEHEFFAARNGTAPAADHLDTAEAARFIAEFDAELAGATSVLADSGARNEAIVAAAVREVLGLAAASLPDAEAIELVLSPARNRILGEAMNLTTHSKLSRALFHARYTFRKKLSHAGDSQDQRHRMTPASRPILMRHYTGRPDYITPALIHEAPEAAELYTRAMDETWQAVNQLLDSGATPEAASYLLPNAVAIRFTESADLLSLHHKMAMRLCYNAQEEIWRASLDEALAITRAEPLIGQWLLPPCGLRRLAARKPICPEGDRYCGVPVWRVAREDYARLI